jgi:hypothetical protein
MLAASSSVVAAKAGTHTTGFRIAMATSRVRASVLRELATRPFRRLPNDQSAKNNESTSQPKKLTLTRPEASKITGAIIAR